MRQVSECAAGTALRVRSVDGRRESRQFAGFKLQSGRRDENAAPGRLLRKMELLP